MGKKISRKEAETIWPKRKDEGNIKKENFNKLQIVLDKCRQHGVGFGLIYEESGNQWYCTINSLVTKKSFVGHSSIFDIACDDAIEWLDLI